MHLTYPTRNEEDKLGTTKNAYFGRGGREGLGARGVPFYKKTTFWEGRKRGARGPTTKKTFL